VSSVTFILPIRTVSESNAHEHWRIRHRRSKEQREAAHIRTLGMAKQLQLPPQPWRITLTRIGKRRLDTGNNPGSMKHVQDGLCDALKIDDGDERHDWIYKQRIEKQYAVEVRIETNPLVTPTP
jgi:hypothetical protein